MQHEESNPSMENSHFAQTACRGTLSVSSWRGCFCKVAVFPAAPVPSPVVATLADCDRSEYCCLRRGPASRRPVQTLRRELLPLGNMDDEPRSRRYGFRYADSTTTRHRRPLVARERSRCSERSFECQTTEKCQAFSDALDWVAFHASIYQYD